MPFAASVHQSKDYKNAGCRRMSVARSLNAHCNQCSYSKKSRSLAICMHAIRFSRWDRFLDLLLYAGRRVYRPLPFLSPNVAVFSMTWLLPAGWERIIILALMFGFQLSSVWFPEGKKSSVWSSQRQWELVSVPVIVRKPIQIRVRVIVLYSGVHE